MIQHDSNSIVSWPLTLVSFILYVLAPIDTVKIHSTHKYPDIYGTNEKDCDSVM